MPASSMFADMERPTPTPTGSSTVIDESRALHQLALGLSFFELNSSSTADVADSYGVQSLDDRANNKRSQNMTECVGVPSSEHVAEIVGRQGCKIKALRAKTNTYIKTPVRGEDPIFVVTGRKEDVGMAKREILSAAEHFSQIRACRKNNLNGSMAPGPPTNVPGQVTIQVRVPYRVVGLVVGPKGATIKRIQQQTHTYIVTPSRDKEPVFEVTGLPESVEQAKKEIEAHIAMRTGNMLEQDDPSAVAALAARHPDGLDLFSSDFVSSIYKLSPSLGGLAGLNSGSSLTGLGGSNHFSSNSLNQTLNQLNDISFPLLNEGSSLLPSGKGAGLESSLFNSLSGSSGSSGKLSDTGLSSLYGVDEGLGSLGSSMGSSPSFDPTPSTLWGDLTKSLVFGPTVNSSQGSTLSSLSSTLTRRSSSVSGASPPSSRLSPTMELGHAPARQINSDPSLLSGSVSLASMTSALTSGLGGGIPSSSTSTSPSSTPELALSRGGADLKGEKRCFMCRDAEVDAALVPCGHNLFCIACANKLSHEGTECPICHMQVAQAIRIFS